MLFFELLEPGCEFDLHGEKTFIICPDHYKYSEVNALGLVQISNFVQEQLQRRKGPGQYLKKDELLIHLATVWKKYFSEKSYSKFHSTYTLFLDLRSYTLNFELLENIQDEFDPTIFSALKIFYQYMDMAEIIDEQKAYSLIGNMSFKWERLILWEFYHLSASQIDMLRTISQNKNIHIPIPYKVWEERTPWDWISAMNVFAQIKVHERIKNCNKKIKIFYYKKGELANAIELYKGSQDIQNYSLVLVNKKNKILNLDQLHIHHSIFNGPCSIFDGLLIDASEELKGLARHNVLSPQQLLIKIDKKIHSLTDKKNINFRLLKIWIEIKKNFIIYRDLSKENRRIGFFDLDLLINVCELNLSKLFYINLSREKMNEEITDFDQCSFFIKKDQILLCSSNLYNFCQKKEEERYSQKILNFLSTIGTLKQEQLEVAFYREKVLKTLMFYPSILFIEKDFLERDFFWNEIFEEIKDLVEEVVVQKKIIEDPAKKNYLKECTTDPVDHLKFISAARLQTYIDCPRKYFFQYIAKLQDNFELKSAINPRHLGFIQHKIIGLYINKNIKKKIYAKLIDHKLKELIDYELSRLINGEVFSINQVQYSQYFYEIYHHTSATIEFLLSLKETDPSVEYLFEVPLANDRAIGSIDCIVEGDRGFSLFDFKRSLFGIPSLIEIMNYIKIQIPFYLNFHNFSLKDLRIWGYVNMNDMDKSLLFSEDPEEKVNVKLHRMNLSIDSFMDKFKEKSEQILLEIKNDSFFKATPRHGNVCKFCKLNNICERE